MRKGFIFSYEFCVGCKACSAACMLENDWLLRSRNIYSTNSDCFRPDPVLSLSMACNHCTDAACQRGCPTGAFSKDPASGAVIIDPEKCIGCRYCTWNCPYDAPKYNLSEGVIEKCHFCFHRLADGNEPACSSACPTGALSFGEIPESIRLDKYNWIPEKGLNPSLVIQGKEVFTGPDITPQLITNEPEKIENDLVGYLNEWSLTLFTFLLTLSVAISAASPFTDKPVPGYSEAVLIALAAIFSVFHLGSKFKAWRAVRNLRHSPLSREILLFIIYSGLVFASLIIDVPYSGILKSLTGILVVFAIDAVYIFQEEKGYLRVRSGQSVLMMMLMVSFFLDAIIPFVFIALIRAYLTIRSITEERLRGMFVIRFLRLSFLIIPGMSLISGGQVEYLLILFIYLSGEFLDRIIFYMDFRPANIKGSMSLNNP